MEALKRFTLKSILLVSLFSLGSCVVTVRPIAPQSIGGSVTIYCDLVGATETISNLIWRRYSYNGSNNLNLLPANLPTRYTKTDTQVNSTYILSTIAINGITTDDFATFECSSSGTDRQNLTLLVTTTASTTTTTLLTTTTVDPLTLCYNQNNSVTYALLIIALVILCILLFGFLKLLNPRTALDVLVTFGCVVGSVAFLIIVIIFWISPTYAGPSPSSSYWSPIVIIPSLLSAFFVLWGGILFFVIKSYKTDQAIKFLNLIIVVGIFIAQLILLLVILCSVVYCTGRSTLPYSSLNYAIVSNICSALTLGTCFVFVIYFFWIFKEQMTSIGIIRSVEKAKIKNFTNPSGPSDAVSPDGKNELPLLISIVNEESSRSGRKSKAGIDETESNMDDMMSQADLMGFDDNAETGKKKKGNYEQLVADGEPAPKKKGKKGAAESEEAPAEEEAAPAAREKSAKGKKGKKGAAEEPPADEAAAADDKQPMTGKKGKKGKGKDADIDAVAEMAIEPAAEPAGDGKKKKPKKTKTNADLGDDV